MADSNRDQIALFTHQLAQVKSPFDASKWKAARAQWKAILNRNLEVEFEDELKKWGHGIDLETPELEHFYTEHVKILGIGQTDVVTHALEESADAKKDIEDIGVWKQAWLYSLNEAGNVSQSMSEAQVGVGLWIGRIHWKMPGEFEWPDEEEGEDLPTYTTRSLKARDKYYSLAQHNEFSIEDISHDQIYWGPKRDDPDLVFQESVIPFNEYRLLTNQNGKYASIDAATKKVIWLGKPEAVDADTDTTGNKIHMVTRAMREPGTNHWTLTRYVYPSTGDLFSDGELFDERDVPAGMCPYVFVPSGEEQVRETDPHLRYRPKMYRSYVHAVEWNYLRSLIAVLARKEAGDHYLYIDPSYSLKPEMLPMLEELGLIDGVGQQRRMTYRAPDPGPGEIALSARYFRKPESPKEALFWLLEDTKEAFAATAPNRFLTGNAYDETRQGTGTAVVNQTQAAAFTYDGDLDEQAKGWRYILQFIDATILCWEKDNKVSKPYFLPVTESFMKKAPDPRTNVFINADKLQRQYAVAVNVTNETQQEKLLRFQLADRDFLELHIIDLKEYLRRRDVANPTKRINELNEERHRAESAEEYKEYERQARAVLRSAITGINFMPTAQAAAAPPAQLPQPGQAMAPQQPQPMMPQAGPVLTGDSMGQGAGLTPPMGQQGFQ